MKFAKSGMTTSVPTTLAGANMSVPSVVGTTRP